MLIIAVVRTTTVVEIMINARRVREMVEKTHSSFLIFICWHHDVYFGKESYGVFGLCDILGCAKY